MVTRIAISIGLAFASLGMLHFLNGEAGEAVLSEEFLSTLRVIAICMASVIVLIVSFISWWPACIVWLLSAAIFFIGDTRLAFYLLVLSISAMVVFVVFGRRRHA